MMGGPSVPLLPPPDPELSAEEIRSSEAARAESMARGISTRQKRGPAQLSSSAPGLTFRPRKNPFDMLG